LITIHRIDGPCPGPPSTPYETGVPSLCDIRHKRKSLVPEWEFARVQPSVW
jgi:hypothetical protein